MEVTKEGEADATTFAWDIVLLCGDPADESNYFAGFPKDQVSPISLPDNITFDMNGNLWMTTDGQLRFCLALALTPYPLSRLDP